MGNLRSKQLGGRTVSVSYDGLNQASYINDSAATNRSLGYDARGNVKFLGNQTMIYDRSDQPIILQGMITGNYIYDGALSGSEEVPLGCNMKRVKSTAGGDLIYNIYDASGALVYIDNVTANKKITYIDKLARVTQIGATTPVTTYLHMDHLGSAVAGTLQSGAINWTERYTPYGEKLTNPIANQDQASFTGHIDDKLTGLTYMQARYYEPIIGRFLSVDPVGFTPDRPEMFGRYTYVGNDPIGAIDAHGLCPSCMQEDFNQQLSESFGGNVQAATGFWTTPEMFAAQKREINMLTTIVTITPIGKSAQGTLLVGKSVIGGALLRRGASRSFGGASKYINSITSAGKATAGRTTQRIGTGGQTGAQKLFKTLTGAKGQIKNGAIGKLGDGVKVQISRNAKSGVTSVRLTRKVTETGSRLSKPRHTKIRFKDKD